MSGPTYQDVRIAEMRHLIVELTQVGKDVRTEYGMVDAPLDAAIARAEKYLEMLKKGES